MPVAPSKPNSSSGAERRFGFGLVFASGATARGRARLPAAERLTARAGIGVGVGVGSADGSVRDAAARRFGLSLPRSRSSERCTSRTTGSGRPPVATQ